MASNNLLPLMIRLRQELNAPAETPEPVEAVDEKAREGLSLLNEKMNSLLEAGNVFAVVARVSSGAAADMQASITWQEDL